MDAYNRGVLQGLELPTILRERIHVTVNPPEVISIDEASPNQEPSAIVYLPSVVLRHEHNPAFAVACRLANKHEVPLVVLAVLLTDEQHLPNAAPGNNMIVGTARRVTFTLEALQSAIPKWEQHNAGVALLLERHNHGESLNLPGIVSKMNTKAVVLDEPFVHPYLHFVQPVEASCRQAHIPCIRVDGSTTVPPRALLKLKVIHHHQSQWTGVPSKAWLWEKQTNSRRKDHVWGTVKDGHLDAPALEHRLPCNFLADVCCSVGTTLNALLPTRTIASSDPFLYPWMTAQELSEISDLKAWVVRNADWLGVDASVAPCVQTHGSTESGLQRWNHFRQKHLASYAKMRNRIVHPHSVSRMSCYLNLGIVSIYRVIAELWQTQRQRGQATGCHKFADEIIKWREHGYAHTFANPHNYNGAATIPAWAQTDLHSYFLAPNNGNHSFTLEDLERARTTDETWNAMQQYLIHTGELHNNARMTWGKTMVHWQKHQYDLPTLLQQMCHVNDRFALDGLSPPSYSGLMWCLGWGDKAATSIPQKPAARYRTGPSGFEQAAQVLLSGEPHSTSSSGSQDQSIKDMLQSAPRQERTVGQDGSNKRPKTTAKAKPQQATMDAFLVPQNKEKRDKAAAFQVIG